MVSASARFRRSRPSHSSIIHVSMITKPTLLRFCAHRTDEELRAEEEERIQKRKEKMAKLQEEKVCGDGGSLGFGPRALSCLHANSRGQE